MAMIADASTQFACPPACGDRRVLALCTVALAEGGGVVVPAGALAQVWLGGGRQVAVPRVVDAAGTVVEPLDSMLAKLAGMLCGRAGASDVVDASVCSPPADTTVSP